MVSCMLCADYSPDTLGRAVSGAIDAAGGLPPSLFSGAKVLLKPNLLSARRPEDAVTTHPEFVRAVVREIRLREDISEIYLGDSPATERPWELLWEKTGMEAVSREEGVKLLPFDKFERREIPGVGIVPLFKDLGSFDAVISLPKLKTHLLTKITAAVKNTYGQVVGRAKSSFHGDHPSPRKMSSFLARVYPYCRSDFVVMDAVVSMQGNGPAGGRPFDSGLVFAGRDAVAVDSRACRVYGYTADEIPLLAELAERGAGVIESDRIEFRGDGLERLESLKGARSASDFLYRFPEALFHLVTNFVRCRPWISPELCIRCGACAEACSRNAISYKRGRFKVKGRKCILCMCCIESCPVDAIKLRGLFHPKSQF